jgi:ADP-L-glycero-D-manno-heptose 6-epimerase
MIALTGAGGFIGSVVLGYLNRQGITDVYLFDDLPESGQFKNLIGKRYLGLHSTKEIVTDIKDFDCVIHIGANSNTLEKDWSSIYDTNVLSTRRWHDLCREHDKKFIFTSSAAVYGNGQGPLNQYAFSKLASEQEITNGVILRLFNVYGPNEYHKGRMASTVLHWYNQIQQTGQLKIFKDSNQYRRDFIYVEDVVSTIYHFVENYKPGMYDLGTGVSVDFDSIANIVINECGQGEKSMIVMPDDLKAQYQLDTKADTGKLELAGVSTDLFYEPQQGIREYCKYLKTSRFY